MMTPAREHDFVAKRSEAHPASFEISMTVGGVGSLAEFIRAVAAATAVPLGLVVNGVFVAFENQSEALAFANHAEAISKMLARQTERPWQWGIVEIVGRRTHMGRYREISVAAHEMFEVLSLNADGEEERFLYMPRAIFSLQPTTEEELKRRLLPSWQDPCCFFEPSPLLPDVCASCGHSREEEQRRLAEIHEMERGRAIPLLIVKALREQLNPRGVEVRWNENPNEPHANVIDVTIHRRRIPQARWEIVRGRVPEMLPWNDAATARKLLDEGPTPPTTGPTAPLFVFEEQDEEGAAPDSDPDSFEG